MTQNAYYVNGSCHCESNVFRVEFDRASLPIHDDLCHCNTCRHATGQMAVHHTSFVGVPLTRVHEHGSRGGSEDGEEDEEGGELRVVTPLSTTTPASAFLAPPAVEISHPKEPFDLGELTAYKSSDGVTRFFCSSCSAHLFWVLEGPDHHWAVAVGSLAEVARVSRIAYHIWVRDTLDGGLADHLRSVDGVQLRRYGEGLQSPEIPLGWRDELALVSGTHKQAPSSTDTLRGYCHCGAIKFAITRPSEASSYPTSPYPDLLHSHLYSHLSTISNPKDEKWWLRPTNSSTPTKYLAGHCVCSVCRLNSGFEIQSWAFIPLTNIVLPNDDDPANSTFEPLVLNDGGQAGRRPKNLKQYITNTGNYREFCRTCGATAFSWQAAVPDLIYISVGLLDEKEHGARAEDWLEWHTGRVSFQESALDQQLVKGLQDGLKLDN